MKWIEEARSLLDRSRRADGAWGYRPGGQPFAEPTALGALAQRAHEADPEAALAWLADRQRPDGGVPASELPDAPAWPTALALLAWAEVPAHAAAAERAADFLLARRGKHWERDPSVGHDTSIVGWPWVADTHSWVEPTSLAVCALRRAGRGTHPRVLEGLRMLRNRALPTGGWNYGNTTVLGTLLQAFPAPTAIALLALAPGGNETKPVRGAVHWLTGRVAGLESPFSLAWTALGLEVAGARPASADAQLERAFRRISASSLRLDTLALLLLAAARERGVALLGGRP